MVALYQPVIILFAIAGGALATTYWVRAWMLLQESKGDQDIRYSFIMGLASFIASVGVFVSGWGVSPFNLSMVGGGILTLAVGGLVMAVAYIDQARFLRDPASKIKRYYDIGVAVATVVGSAAVFWFGLTYMGLTK